MCGSGPHRPEQKTGSKRKMNDYIILIFDHNGAPISEDPFTGSTEEAEKEARRRMAIYGGVSYSLRRALQPVYTPEQWAKDRTFSAYPGQQISKEIYYEMLDCMPPLDLPGGAADQIRERYGVTITGGFLMGEPYGCNKNGLTYSCFGRSGGKYYFFGELNA